MKSYTLNELKDDRTLWISKSQVDVLCDKCGKTFKLKYGTLYNIIRRNASGLYCTRKCGGAAKSEITQEKYSSSGGKTCKRCEEFKPLSEFWPLPNPPYYRAECKSCRNNKKARQFSFYRDRSRSQDLVFNVTNDDFCKILSLNCYFCNSSSNIIIDLKNNEEGYVLENIIPACKLCVKLKAKFSFDDFKKICVKICKNLESKNE